MQRIRKKNMFLAKKKLNIFLFLPLLFYISIASADNPIIKHLRTADPDAHVWKDGKVWIYPSHDQDNATNYSSMDGYHVFSSSDMVNWNDHGEILHSRDVKWAVGGTMYAPCAAYKNGKYYFYFPTICNKGEWSWRIGVAISDKPEGPFKEIGNYIKGTDNIDPCSFVDDDGSAYLYWGGEDHGDAVPKVAKLKENMIELAETPRIVDYGRYDKNTGAEKLSKNQRFGEGSYMHKRNGIYYFSYNGSGGKYAMGTSPYGPFEYKGVFNSNKNTGAQDHHSMIEHNGKSYFFYHVGNYNDGTNNSPSMFRRNVCVDYLYYNEDGTMKEVVLTKKGVDPVTIIPTKRDTIPKRIEAENYSNMSGVKNENTQDQGGGKNIGSIENGDWVEYLIHFRTVSNCTIDFRCATATQGGNIDILLNGKKISTITVDESKSDGWQNWFTQTANLDSIDKGDHTLRLNFIGNSGTLFNLNWIDIKTESSIMDSKAAGSGGFFVNSDKVKSHGSTIRIWFNLSERTQVDIAIYDINGKMLRKLISGVRENGKNEIECFTGDFSSGMYFFRLYYGKEVVAKPIMLFK